MMAVAREHRHRHNHIAEAFAEMAAQARDLRIGWVLAIAGSASGLGVKESVTEILPKFRNSGFGQDVAGPQGVMRVVDFDRGAVRIFAQPGDLGISLDDINPLAVLSFLAPRLAGVPITQSLMQAMLASAMAASVDYLARRYTGFAKDNGWLAANDNECAHDAGEAA